MTTFDQASDLVSAQLGRTINYPTETKAFCGLVNALIKAEKITGAPAAKIAELCAETSKFCPTDADLISIGRDIARCDAVAAGTFDSLAGAGNYAQPVDHAAMCEQYGEPASFDWQKLDAAKIKRVRSREKEMLAKIKAKYPGTLGWHQMAAAAEEFGYHDYAKAWREEFGYHDYAKAWRNSSPGGSR